MRFAGIDVNSNQVDVVLLDEEGGTAEYHRRRIDTGPNIDAFQRARRLRDAMPARGAWIDYGVLAIGIEKPQGRFIGSVAAQMRVQGALLACLPIDLTIYEFGPTEWKRAAIGRGNATKDDGATWARQHWTNPPERINQDAFDAYAIAFATRARYQAKPQPVRLNTSAA